MIRILQITPENFELLTFNNIDDYNTFINKEINPNLSVTLGSIPDINDVESGSSYLLFCNLATKDERNININKYVTGFANRLIDFELQNYDFVGTAYLVKYVNDQPDFITLLNVQWIMAELLNYTKETKFQFDVSIRLKHSNLYFAPMIKPEIKKITFFEDFINFAKKLYSCH